MNERFRELRKQAAREVSNANQWTNDDEWNELFLAKFAELIVGECINNVQVWETDSRNHISYMLKQHFGVEE